MTRRELFTQLTQKEKPVEDPLFEKYRRHEFQGRNQYSDDFKKYHNTKKTDDDDVRIGVITSGLAEYTGAWTAWEARHLLRRTSFGVRKADVDALMGMTMSDAVDMILTIDPTVPSPPVNYYENIPMAADENGLPYGADWTTDPINSFTTGFRTNYFRWNGLKYWNLGLALNSDMSIREKMVWFWYHFIPVDFQSVESSPNPYCGNNSARICYHYIKMFRDNALGNFKNIITQMATQPAMMFYLNNQANTNTAPDENFAREIMELFTLGKDPLSQYTEADVVQAAKVLTGWRVTNLNTLATTTAFDASFHETSDKTFSSFFDFTTIPNSGAAELGLFIDMLFSKEQVISEYICRRLYRYFVYYDIDANIEANVIVPLAQQLVLNNWEMLPTLRTLFKSEHFYDMANKGVYIKSPFDLVIGTLRSFQLPCNVTDSTNHEAQNVLWFQLHNQALEPIGQEMGRVPNVSGWVPFYQNPSFHEYWINSNTTQKRFALMQQLFDGFYSVGGGLTTLVVIDPIAFVQQFDAATIADPNLLTTACLELLLPVELSITQRDTIKIQSLLSGLTTDSYWTTAWSNYMSDPTNATFLFIVKSRLKSLLYTITQLAEYQLM